MIKFIPKQIIIEDRFLALIFGETDKKNKNIAVPFIRSSVITKIPIISLHDFNCTISKDNFV
ncbi:hypothetical protein [Bacillus wiedmannii]|uniref:hypothetical protein n=1 Tax=Bacillus wiedmannii TaxID=1890302 RepID=UPI001C3F3908|nr:hypothetical protein [Bacillus wiedmannii]